ncbi:HNH endonuclease [Candidatus Cardinium hertigii]
MLDNGEQLHVDHIIPKALEDSNNLENLNLLHAICHRKIHSKQRRAVA